MTGVMSEGLWCVCSQWTCEPNLSSGYDEDRVEAQGLTLEAARSLRDQLSRERIGTVDVEDPEDRTWCIGVAIAREPEPGYSPSPDPKDMIWADWTPDEVLEW